MEPVAKVGPAESSDWLKEPKDEEDPIQISDKVIYKYVHLEGNLSFCLLNNRTASIASRTNQLCFYVKIPGTLDHYVTTNVKRTSHTNDQTGVNMINSLLGLITKSGR